MHYCKKCARYFESARALEQHREASSRHTFDCSSSIPSPVIQTKIRMLGARIYEGTNGSQQSSSVVVRNQAKLRWPADHTAHPQANLPRNSHVYTAIHACLGVLQQPEVYGVSWFRSETFHDQVRKEEIEAGVLHAWDTLPQWYTTLMTCHGSPHTNTLGFLRT